MLDIVFLNFGNFYISLVFYSELEAPGRPF